MESRHVIITGAGSGLGLGIALTYLQRGDFVSILARIFHKKEVAWLFIP